MCIGYMEADVFAAADLEEEPSLRERVTATCSLSV